MARGFITGLIALAAMTLALAAAAGAAETQTPFTEAIDNPCTGEALAANGKLVTETDTTVGADGRLHTHSNVSFHGMTATAPLSGHKYVVQDQTLDSTNSDSDAAPSTTDFHYKIHWVRTGEDGSLITGDDFYDWFHVHLTINANGVPTSTTIDTTDEVCR